MVLQLLLGGVSGVYVIFRLFKQKILRMLGVRNESATPVNSAATGQAPTKNEDLGRSA